jgi:hypothetical protein
VAHLRPSGHRQPCKPAAQQPPGLVGLPAHASPARFPYARAAPLSLTAGSHLSSLPPRRVLPGLGRVPRRRRRVHLRHAFGAWPARQGTPPGYLSRPPLPGHPHPSRRLCLPCAAGAKTLASAAAVESPPPPLPRRREAARELRLEVSYTPALFVFKPEHRGALATSLEYPSRAAALSTCAAASPLLPPPLAASSPPVLHVGVFRAPNHALKP